MSQKLENAKGLYLEGIRDGNAIKTIGKYSGERYIQHNTGAKDGQEGLKEFFKDFVVRYANREVEVILGWVCRQRICKVPGVR